MMSSGAVKRQLTRGLDALAVLARVIVIGKPIRSGYSHACPILNVSGWVPCVQVTSHLKMH